MALRGTLKDFGIADILQLIGQQQKTGILRLSSKPDEVVISFFEGNIIRAETAIRANKDLIGSMLVSAGIITQPQLDNALATQKRTLERAGDVLISHNVVTAEQLARMVHLQATETLYRLFLWQSGTYAFEQTNVDKESNLAPIRAESVLMEGFRRVDEWPLVRKRITTLQMTFEQLKNLPVKLPTSSLGDDEDGAFDDWLSETEGEMKGSQRNALGDNEYKVFPLAVPGRTAARIVELSLLGEFETAKALCNLINSGYLRGLQPTSKGGPDYSDRRAKQLPLVLGLAGAVTVALVVVLFIGSRLHNVGLARIGTSASQYKEAVMQRHAGLSQMSRIQAALEVYKLENGEFPKALQQLVDARILSEDDIRHPWRDVYYYRRMPVDGYTLLPPLR